MQEQDRSGGFVWRVEQNREIPVGMEAAGDEGTRGLFEAQALRADGDATVGTDAGLRALAKDVGPPGAFGSGA